MKFQRYIGIYVITSDDISIKKLSTIIEKKIKKYFKDTPIILETNEPYWKIPKSKCIEYSILNNNKVKVLDIINLFSISWNYDEGHAYDISIKQTVETEDAIWAQNCHPEEQFLMPEVRWAHIYTTEQVENPIIN